jgi:sec-independent protein translocase protein TatC
MADFPPEPPDDGGGPVKSFLEHLEDFRWVIVKCAVALSLAMLVCLIGANYVIALIKWPMTQAHAEFPGTNQIATVSFGTNRIGRFELAAGQSQALGLGTNRLVSVVVEPVLIGTNRVLSWRLDERPEAAQSAQSMNIELVNLSPVGGFFVAFQVALYGGMVLAAPFLLYFIAAYIFPALRLRERKYVFRALFIGGGLFALGVAFCYFILMPIALSASQMYSNWLGFGATQWRAEDYISFVCRFMLGMGLGFELPVVILTLVKIGVLNYAILSKARRYMIVINLVLGAVLTTPEVVTQILMFVPLQLLFELTVWITWYWERKDRKRALQDGDSG